MIILKTIVDSKDFSYFNRNKMAMEYTKTLDEEWWVNSLLEGGYISPDFSTIFYYGRSPYEGQLIQFNKDAEGYNNILNRLIEKGDFVSYNIK